MKVSADLQQARVYYTTLGDEKAQRSRRGRSTARRRSSAASSASASGCGASPELEFFFDETIEKQRSHRADPPGPRRARRAGQARTPARARRLTGRDDDDQGTSSTADRPAPSRQIRDAILRASAS